VGRLEHPCAEQNGWPGNVSCPAHPTVRSEAAGSYVSASRFEVRRFLTITFDEQDQKLEPLQYWNVKRKDFPLLSLVAVHVFVVLPHSCEAERTFSAAGNICNEQRSSLTNEMINHLVLIHRNDRLFRAEAAARAKAAAAEETAASAAANSNAAGHSVPGPPAPVVLE